MGRSKLLAPVVVAILTLVAFATIAVLVQRADASRRQQLEVASLKGAGADLPNAAFNADPHAGGSPVAGRRQIRADERTIERGLSAASQPAAPTTLLAEGHERLRALTPAIAAVYRIAVAPGGLNGPQAAAVPRLQQLVAARSAQLVAVLDRVGVVDARRAERDKRDATLGAASALLLLLIVFTLFYVRFVRAHAVGERMAQENLRLLNASREEATSDPLTGLGNRRALEARLERESRAPPGGHELLLALFDLDGFKQYNDSFGHAAGDSLLQRLGARLTAAAAARNASTYRLGGDEFCLVARCGPEDAAGLLGDAAAALAESGEAWEVGCSYGAAWISSEASSGSDAMHLADQRMYANKTGRTSPGRQITDVLLAVMNEQYEGLDTRHCQVAELATLTAQSLNLPAVGVRLIRLAAAIHDVGKMAIPSAMLTKPGPLEAEEWSYMERHTLIGERIVLAAPALALTAPLVRSSHERVDGHGYPDGLAGEQIPLGARVIAVCDAYVAMTSGCPYRTAVNGLAVSAEVAIEELRRGSDTQFDPRVVDAFLSVVPTAPPATVST